MDVSREVMVAMDIEEYAPAKFTWSLRVLGTRPDGYHEILALATMISDPGDRLVLRAHDTITLRVSGSTHDVPADATNLAWRAAEAADVTVAMELTKRIPAGGGLGGGSSDAAAVLRALRRDFGLAPHRARAIAAELGSDVAACLEGGTAWLRGRGELVEPVEPPAPTPVVVAVPPIHSSTAAVYRAWDELGGPRGERVVEAPPALRGLATELVNDLEPAAEHVEPRLATFRRDLAPVIGREPLLAGSGAAYVAWCVDVDEARALGTRVEGQLGVATFVGIAG